MGFFDRFLGRRKATLALPTGWRRFLSALPFGGFSTVIEDAYRKNATVAACVFVLSAGFPEPELHAWERGERNELKLIPRHPLRALMAKPNSDMGEAELLQFVVTYASLGGNAYLWKQRNRAGKVIALWAFHDGQMTPIPGRSTREGVVAYYVLNDGTGKSGNPWGIDRFDTVSGVAIPKSEIIHWKWMIDPLHPERGMGAIAAAAGDVRLANEARDFVYSYLKNNAVPPVVVTLTEGDELTDEKARRLRKQWRAAYGGENRGTPAFLEAGMTAITLGQSLRDLDFSALRNGPDAAICQGFHIQPGVVGALVGLEHNTYANFEEANRALALQTLAPLWRSFASEVEQSMRGEIGFSEDEVIRFDLSQVRALQDSQNAIEERLGRAFDRGGITRAEYRRALGYETTPEDEVFKENLASIWVPRGMLRTADPALLEAESERQEGGDKTREASERKMREVGAALRRIRGRHVAKMEARLRGYFGGLAARIEETLRDEGKSRSSKAAADAAGLLREADGGELERILGGEYLSIAEASWELWNVALGIHPVFDRTDPVISEILQMAGARVTEIHRTTVEALRETLIYGNEHGWSVDDLVEGDAEAGIRGIRDIVQETYSGRARTIARTELGTAQNTASARRYEAAGVDAVLILDNGDDDDDSACKIANGQVWTRAYFEAHLLEHPNCTRAAAPYFGDRKPDRA